jgi:hypothetical protein
MVPASEELAMLVAALQTEVSSWPGVRLKSMFGMTALYRGGKIFGLLPKTRNLRAADHVWLKFAKLTPAIQKRIAAEPRMVQPHKPTGAQWYTLTAVSPQSYALVHDWLAIAHRAAK